MNSVIICKTYADLPFCEKEILRYAGCKKADNTTLSLLNECIDEIGNKPVFKVCYGKFKVTVNEDICDFGEFKLQSKNLAQNLNGCKNAVVFAATVGIEIDRLILKYGKLSPSKALFIQAIGAERIETLCDAFCNDIKKEYNMGLKPRFSPGYGDLSLESQREIFAILNCEKHIGLTLTDGLIMSPTKSVTAIVGIGGKEKTQNKCDNCNNVNCSFRGKI